MNRNVVVTTKHRGVFFGHMVEQEGTTVTLENARNCLCWSRVMRGFVGLATIGPNKDCRVGPAAKTIVLYDVTAIIEASDEAAAAWEAEPWKN
jgi:hypothetical protein